MPASSKAELLRVTTKEYDKLVALLEKVPAAHAVEKHADDTSIKDVIAHRAHWIDLFLGWYRDGQAGAEVQFPAPGYKWNQLKVYNAQLRADQAGVGWDDACAMLADRHGKLVSFLEGLGEVALYGGKMKGARNDWTTGRWAEAAGPSHYRSAAKDIRARLKALAG